MGRVILGLLACSVFVLVLVAVGHSRVGRGRADGPEVRGSDSRGGNSRQEASTTGEEPPEAPRAELPEGSDADQVGLVRALLPESEQAWNVKLKGLDSDRDYGGYRIDKREVEFRLPSGRYEFEWYVFGAGCLTERLLVAPGKTHVLDYRHLAAADLSPDAESARLVVRVRDVSGRPAGGARVRFRSPAWDEKHPWVVRTADQNGNVNIHLPASAVDVECGDVRETVALEAGRYHECELPGDDLEGVGELTVATEWASRVHKEDDPHLVRAPDVAAGGGESRFLFLRAGTYKVLAPNGVALGEVKVTAGASARYECPSGALVLSPVDNEGGARGKRRLIYFKIQGASVGASHTEGYRIGWGGGEMAPVFGLAPGLYEVSSEDPEYGVRQMCRVRAGSLAEVTAELRKGR